MHSFLDGVFAAAGLSLGGGLGSGWEGGGLILVREGMGV